jgi:hypothetical protein
MSPRRLHRITALALAMLGLAAASASAATRYVKQDASGANDGNPPCHCPER